MYSRGTDFFRLHRQRRRKRYSHPDHPTARLTGPFQRHRGCLLFDHYLRGKQLLLRRRQPYLRTKSGTTYSRTGACTNYGRFVFTSNTRKGNTSLTGGSIFGTPTGPFIVTTTPPITTTPDITGADSVSRTGNLSSFNLISPLPQETARMVISQVNRSTWWKSTSRAMGYWDSPREAILRMRYSKPADIMPQLTSGSSNRRRRRQGGNIMIMSP